MSARHYPPQEIHNLFKDKNTQEQAMNAYVSWLQRYLPAVKPGDILMVPNVDCDGILEPWEYCPENAVQ